MVMEFTVPTIAALLRPLSLDFVLFDLEHTGLSLETLAPLLVSCRLANVPAVVRVPGPSGHFISRCLDLGALGIMMPNVRSAEEARRFVEAAKYPPWGRRGMGLGGAHTLYRMPDSKEYAEWANAQTVLMAQIESPEAVAAIDDILAVPGIDLGWVGQYDLTLNMGIVGQFDHPDFLAAQRRVAEACARQGKGAGCQPGSVALAREWFDAGYNVISLGTDIGVYQRALERFLGDVRAFSP
jgi:2-dehydro-3-deoxyglucarate aldolase/4-hydroxy-2-oxoheptanedioate aldolase